MSFDQWLDAIERTIASRKLSFKLLDLDGNKVRQAFDEGVSPVEFATSSDIPFRKTVDQTHVPRPIPQHDAVKSDPKWLLDTGTDLSCPVCGSTFLKFAPKTGTGFGFLGSIGWVVAASAVDSVIASLKEDVLVCGYCESAFPKSKAAPREQVKK
ncbi:hypothetical protein EON81_05370 [bacterium]|nr:MAG: hypothetical protein EON81_05370 [bacterium]